MEPKKDERSPIGTIRFPEAKPPPTVDGPLWIQWLMSWGDAADDFLAFIDEEIDRIRANYATLFAENKLEQCHSNAGYELALTNLRIKVRQYKMEEISRVQTMEKQGERKRLRL